MLRIVTRKLTTDCHPCTRPNPGDPICPKVFAAFFSGLLTGYTFNYVMSEGPLVPHTPSS
jgi:hypothetical protein